MRTGIQVLGKNHLIVHLVVEIRVIHRVVHQRGMDIVEDPGLVLEVITVLEGQQVDI